MIKEWLKKLNETDISYHIVDIFRQLFPVKEAVNIRQINIRIHALVNVIEGTVFEEGHPVLAGNLERGTPGGGHRKDHATAAPGRPPQQRHPLGIFEHRRHQVSAGKAQGGNQAVNIFILQRILFVKNPIQVCIRPVGRR